MSFHGILDERPDRTRRSDEGKEPSFFADLNLDQVLASMIAGREEYRLEPFFYAPLRDVDAVQYRHEVLRDLEEQDLRESVGGFAEQMRAMRKHLAQAEKLRYRYQKQRWFLDAVEIYCDAVSSLAERLDRLDVRSRGFLELRDYLTSYTGSDAFTRLAAETQRVRADLDGVRYSLHIKGDRVTVGKHEGEPDYSVDVARTFAKFRQRAVKDYRVGFPNYPEMNHVEARVLDLVARLYPDVFQALDDFCGRHTNYLDHAIDVFDREVQFYLAYLELIAPLKAAGMSFCYPRVSARSKEIHAVEAFDVALAIKLIPSKSPVVCNDFSPRDRERVLIVTGPNQGGKTTFARMFGQLHYLASLGYPVPGTEARLFLPDRLFAHFEREEDVRTLRGKLEDELVRVRDILHDATGDSILVMNESFTSTTLGDAVFLGTEVLKRIVELEMLCVYVTFVDELASLGEAVVSMVSTVDPENPALRTYKVVRMPADGLAYAAAIAQKYGLTYRALKGRIAS